MASERGNAEEGLVHRDIAQKYMADHERREGKVAELLGVAQDLNDRVEKATKEGRHDEALRLEVAAIRAQVQAMLVFFSIGEPDPEEEPGGET